MTSNNKRTIHVIVNTFSPVVGGIEIHLLEIYGYLVKKGYNVIVHTSKNTATEKNILPDKDMVRGIKIKRYKLRKYGFMPKFDWEKASIVALHDFSTVPHFYILFYVLYLKLLKRKKFVFFLTPHGFLTPNWSIFSKYQALIRKILYPTLARFLINYLADGIRAVSKWEEEKLIAMGIKTSLITTITNGLESAAFSNFDKKVSLKVKQKVKELRRYIIQVGRISREKNYETAIKALEYVAKDVKYIIVGPIKNKRYYEYLKTLAQKLHLNKRVIFLGKIDIYSKYYFIKHAQMMVHMSLSEAFGNSVHEAMSQGLPCVVSNITALPFLVKHNVNGFCLNPKDHKALAEKIEFVLDKKNKKIIQRVKKANTAITRGQTWENIALKVEEFYKSVWSKMR